MRLVRRCGLVALVLLSTAWSDPPAQTKPAGRKCPPATQRRVDPYDAVRALRMQMPKVSMHGLPFDEFVAWLARQSGVNVVPKWKTLERAGVERDTPVTLEMREAQLGDVLRRVLEQLAEGRAPLGFRAHSNIIHISTRADLGRQLVVRTYDVQDLLILVPDFKAMQPAVSRGLTVTEGLSVKDPLQDAGRHVRELVDVITACIYPDSWKPAGGAGTISYYRGRLVVRNTPEVHEALSGELRMVSGETP